MTSREELKPGCIEASEPREAIFRWLIEAPGARYLAVQRLRMSNNFEWTTDHDKALAFQSEEQADALMMAVRQWDRDLRDGKLFAFEVTLGNAKAVEHGWLTACRIGAQTTAPQLEAKE